MMFIIGASLLARDAVTPPPPAEGDPRSRYRATWRGEHIR